MKIKFAPELSDRIREGPEPDAIGATILAIVAGAALAFCDPAMAQDATWLAAPGSGDFNTGANWSPAGVPSGTAFFDASTTTGLSFSGGTTIGGWTFNAGAGAYSFTNAQSLQFTGAGIAINGGSAAITNNLFIEFRNASSAGSATFTNGNDISFFNTSTAGNASITNNSGLGFTNTATAGNATITNNAVTNFLSSSSAGGAMITNTIGAALSFQSTSTGGNATIINDDGGIVTLANDSTAGAAVITNDGRISLENNATAGNATITNNGGVTTGLRFRNASTAGTASITNNAYTLFADTATAGSATIVNNSATGMDFINSATAGNASFTNNNGGIYFQNSTTAATATFTNDDLIQFLHTSSGGSAAITNTASGTVDISTLASAGTTLGSIAGGGSFVLGDNNLEVGSLNTNTTVSGVISGVGGALTKTGAGTLILSGVNTYTGATTVDDGILRINGDNSASSLTTVNAGGTLGGNGTVGDLTINGGTLGPGNSIDTITVNGNLVFMGGSTFDVEVSPTDADRTNVTGTATLDGVVNATFEAGAYLDNTYTILSAASGLGGSTFDTLNTFSLPAGFNVSLNYTGTDVELLLQAIAGGGGSSGGSFASNQQSTSDAITSYFNNGGSLPPEFVTVQGLTGSEAEIALAQLSGEPTAAAQAGAFQATNQFLGLMFNPWAADSGHTNNDLAFGFASPSSMLPNAWENMNMGLGQSSLPEGFSTWASAYGGSSDIDGETSTGSHDISADAYGFAVGLDWEAGPHTTIGFAVASGGTSWDLSGGLGGGDSTSFQVGAHGTQEWDQFYTTGALSYGFHDMSTHRFLYGGDRVSASFNAHSFGGRLESGARFTTSEVKWSPYAALQAQGFYTPDYQERDPADSGFGLAYKSNTSTAARGELGTRFEHTVALNNKRRLNLSGLLAYAHDWNSDSSRSASFQSLPGSSFRVDSASSARNLVLASLGMELKLSGNLTFSARVGGEFAGDTATYTGLGAMKVKW